MPTQKARNILVVAAVALAVCAAVIIPIALTGNHQAKDVAQADAWEDENYPKAIQLKGEAETLALGGKIAEAHEKYRQIEQLVGSHKVRDPRFWDLLQQVKADQDRVYNLALRIMERDVAGALTNDTSPNDPSYTPMSTTAPGA